MLSRGNHPDYHQKMQWPPSSWLLVLFASMTSVVHHVALIIAISTKSQTCAGSVTVQVGAENGEALFGSEAKWKNDCN